MSETAQFLPARQAWQQILLAQARARPCWQLQDVYKLAFQAALGSEHAAPSEPAARRWLEQEVARLNAGPDDPPFEPISPDDRLVRVNLRPYLAEGGNPDSLLQAFLLTATAWHGSREILKQYLDCAVDLTETGELAFPPMDARSYFQPLAEAGFPAAHHSNIYREIYRPAYRVVLLELLCLTSGPYPPTSIY